MADRDPRMSGPTLKVLKILLERPRDEHSGASISKLTKVGAGTLYPLLARLEHAGWIVGEWEDIDPAVLGRPKRRLYWLTGLGQTRARAAFAEFQISSAEGVPSWAS